MKRSDNGVEKKYVPADKSTNKLEIGEILKLLTEAVGLKGE